MQVEITERNLRRHHVEDRVSIAAGDRSSAEGTSLRSDRDQSAVRAAGEWTALAPEYKHEPRRALEAGIDGNGHRRAHSQGCAGVPRRRSMLICESVVSQAEFEQRFPGFPGGMAKFANGGDGIIRDHAAELKHWLDARAAARKVKSNVGKYIGALVLCNQLRRSHGPAIGCVVDGCPPG